MTELINSRLPERRKKTTEEEVYEAIRGIQDPELPNTLEELLVVTKEDTKIENLCIKVMFTPTVPHCSMASLIGLCILYRLKRFTGYTLDVRIKSGTHLTEHQINKQLTDKERVYAAFENDEILSMIRELADSECGYDSEFVDSLMRQR